MGGLAHYFEQEGLATTEISLIRHHSEQIKPPRALWVPYELGRPLGVPNDAAFQHRVLNAVLSLLDEKEGPILVDYPEEAPEGDPIDPEMAMSGMVCPIDLPKMKEDDSPYGRLTAKLDWEIGQLAPWYDLGVEKAGGRTTFGLANMEADECMRYVVSWRVGVPEKSPDENFSAGQVLKSAIEDLKTFYMTALNGQPGTRSSKQALDWFWGDTMMGDTLLRMRAELMAIDDKFIVSTADTNLVPHSQRWRIENLAPDEFSSAAHAAE